MIINMIRSLLLAFVAILFNTACAQVRPIENPSDQVLVATLSTGEKIHLLIGVDENDAEIAITIFSPDGAEIESNALIEISGKKFTKTLIETKKGDKVVTYKDTDADLLPDVKFVKDSKSGEVKIMRLEVEEIDTQVD